MGKSNFVRSHLCLILFLFSFNSFGFECGVKTKEEILEGIPALENYVTKLMTTTSVDGLSLAIYQNGQVLFSKAYGDGLEESLFEAASLSKVMSAFAALELAEKGIIPLDDSLSHHVKKPYLDPSPYSDMVTLRRILDHTSGMSNDVSGNDRKLYFEPGTQFSYSGAGFLYLQQAIEDTTSIPFDEFMQAPMQRLGLDDSNYELHDGGKLDVGAPYSLLTTPAQLGRLFDEIVSPRPENRWVSSHMSTPSFLFDTASSWGLGVAREECPNEFAVTHSGNNFDFHRSNAVMYAGSRTGAVVMARGKDSSDITQILTIMAINKPSELRSPGL